MGHTCLRENGRILGSHTLVEARTRAEGECSIVMMCYIVSCFKVSMMSLYFFGMLWGWVPLAH